MPLSIFIVAPIIDFKLFANSHFLTGLAANFFLSFFYSIKFFYLPLHLTKPGNYSSDQIGLILLPATLMVALLSPLSGALCDRFGAKSVLLTGYILFILSALLQINFSAQHELIWIVLPLVLFGIGWAFILSPSIVTAIAALPETAGGVAMGTVSTWHNFGGTIALALGSGLGYVGGMKLIFITSIIALVIIINGLRK